MLNYYVLLVFVCKIAISILNLVYLFSIMDRIKHLKDYFTCGLSMTFVIVP